MKSAVTTMAMKTVRMKLKIKMVRRACVMLLFIVWMTCRVSDFADRGGLSCGVKVTKWMKLSFLFLFFSFCFGFCFCFFFFVFLLLVCFLFWGVFSCFFCCFFFFFGLFCFLEKKQRRKKIRWDKIWLKKNKPIKKSRLRQKYCLSDGVHSFANMQIFDQRDLVHLELGRYPKWDKIWWTWIRKE